MLVLLFVALWFILRGVLLKVLPCVILSLCFFSPFSIAITSLGEERVNFSAFRTFVRFALVWFCLIHLPLGVWEGLRLVIVALPGLLFPFLDLYLYIDNRKLTTRLYDKRVDFNFPVVTFLFLSSKAVLTSTHNMCF